MNLAVGLTAFGRRLVQILSDTVSPLADLLAAETWALEAPVRLSNESTFAA